MKQPQAAAAAGAARPGLGPATLSPVDRGRGQRCLAPTVLRRSVPMDPTEVVLHRVRVAHLRWRLAALDHARAVVAALEAGADLAELVPDAEVQPDAELPWVADGAVNIAVPAGFDGASVRELGERYAVGELSEDQLCSQLTHWRARHGVDARELRQEVGLLLVDELIDEPLYRRLQEPRVE